MKAKLIILLIVVSMFLISSATAAYVCCEKLAGSDEYCVYTEEEECDSDLKSAAVTCEQTSFCKVGCCYSSDEGECYKNVPRAECSSIEGTTWSESMECEISQCQKGCCLLGSQGFFVTEVKCKQETSNYGNVTMEWKSEILTEPECQALAKSQEMGCCVTGDTCTFTTRELCTSAQVIPVAENQTSEEGFYKNMLCSNDLLACGCAKQTNTGCYNDKVYWFDSCGNRENVYSTDEDKSYNNGYVLKPDEICDSPAVLDPDCGNCDYAQGSICRSANVGGVEPTEGEYICSKTGCDEIYDDGKSPSAGSPKNNGESWCLYDSAVGKARDLVGSRHFRNLCINGEEITEPCMDYREEMCIQGVLGSEPTETFQAFQATGEYIEAACKDNRWEDCYDCNAAEAGCGSDCLDVLPSVRCKDCNSDQEHAVEQAAMELAVKQCCAEKCCANEGFRDCYFLRTGRREGRMQLTVVAEKGKVTSIENIGHCVPQVPPGLQFWPSETMEPPTSTTRSSPATTAAVTTGGGEHGRGTGGPSSNAESVCAQANQECMVKWHIGGWGRLGIGGGDYECTENCQCMTKEWVIGGNNLCKAQGDCGAYFNYLGKATLDGYANTASLETRGSKGAYFNGYDLKSGDLGDWDELVAGSDALGFPSFEDEGDWIDTIEDYITEYGIPLLAIAGSGLVSKMQGGKFMEGATGGFSILGNILSFSKMKQEASNIYGKDTFKKGSTLSKDASFTGKELSSSGYKSTTSTSVTSSGSEAGYEMRNGKLFNTNQEDLGGGAISDKEMAGLKEKGHLTEETSFDGFNQNKDGTWSPEEGGMKAKGELTSTEKTGGGVMGAVNTAAWLYGIYKLVDQYLGKDKEQTYTISCSPWVAPEEKNDCEECNEDEHKPCSIYRCKSLGQSCYLVNQGSSEEKCVSLNPNDVNSPIVEPWEEVIPSDYTITTTTFEGNKGYMINEKIGPYDSITLGILTDEPAQCMFTSKVGTDYDDMTIFFGDSQYLYEHETTFVIPAEFTTKEALREIGDRYTLYIRCKDGIGNKNERDYFIRFTLEQEPDMTAPVISMTSIEKGAYISKETTQTEFSIYVEERAECKYDITDTEYSLMENDFECSTSAFTVNSALYGLYECKTTLDFTNITDYAWYIRCKDTSGNENRESYEFSLTPTDPLEIASIGPTGTSYESEVTLKVVTEKGAENGKAICAYSEEDDAYSNMIVFLTTDSTYHEQPLTPGVGEFTYHVKCIDAALNIARDNTTFTLDIDQEPPKIIYIYVTPSNYLHLEMDEASTCEYSNQTFMFGEGKSMTGAETTIHELSITEKMYHIICQDIYANEASFVVYP